MIKNQAPPSHLTSLPKTIASERASDTHALYIYAPMDSSSSSSSSHLRQPSSGSTAGASTDQLAASVPLVDLSSRTPSPYPRSRTSASAVSASSDWGDDDDGLLDDPASSASLVRPLVAADIGSGGSGGMRRMSVGGVGNWLFGTWAGWQVYVGVLVVWVGGAGFGLLLMNRFILLSKLVFLLMGGVGFG